MSITGDLRGYADTAVSTAVHQSKQFVEQAQAQLTDVSGSVNDFATEVVGKLAGAAKDNVNGLRALGETAEKALHLQALRTAVEPYLEQAKGYTAQVSGRAEALLAQTLGKAVETGKSDPRVAKVLDIAETAAGTVVLTVQQKVVVPLAGLRAGKPAAPKAAPRPATKPAAKPAAKRTATKPAAKRTAANRTAAKPAANNSTPTSPQA